MPIKIYRLAQLHHIGIEKNWSEVRWLRTILGIVGLGLIVILALLGYQ